MKSLHLIIFFVLLTFSQLSQGSIFPSVTFENKGRFLLADNGSVAHINKPYSFRCSVANLDQIEAKNFTLEYIFFFHINSAQEPLIIGSYGKNGGFHNSRTINNNTLKVTYNGNDYPNWASINISPLAFNATTFSCKVVVHDLEKKSNFTVSSKETLTLNILPQAVFTTNTRFVEKGRTFTATCTVALPGSTNLKVNFYKASEGLIASYEVNEVASPNETILTIVDRDKPLRSLSAISAGYQHTYPSFDLQLKSSTDQYDLYWCEVFGEGVKELKNKNKSTISANSAKWPLKPVLTLSFKKNPANKSETIANCLVHNFSAVKRSKAFSVLFQAYYHVVPREYYVANFTVNPSAHLTTVHYNRDNIYGPTTNGRTFPSFAIRKSTPIGSIATSWYCELQFNPELEEDNELSLMRIYKDEPIRIFSNDIRE